MRAWLLAALMLAGLPAPAQALGPAQVGARSILVLPVVNRTVAVNAPELLLTTLPIPLAERGYYVFPVHTTRLVLEQQGLSEPALVHAQSPQQLARLFGADLILYVTINHWEALYLVVHTHVEVDLDYRLVDRDGREVWRASARASESTDLKREEDLVSTLLGAAIDAALARAAPDFLPLARRAHARAFVSGVPALPVGPYLRRR